MSKKKSIHILINEHIRCVEKCLGVFRSFLLAATLPQTPPETLNALYHQLDLEEDGADLALRQMIESLGKVSYLPSTKEDLISIGTRCDKIANKCEYIAKLIVLYGFTFPDGFEKDINTILDVTDQQFELLSQSIDSLFANYNLLQKDHSILDQIRSLETSVDEIEFKLGKQIFALDIELSKKMQFFNLVERMCDISDTIEDIADKIQIMLIARKA